MCQNCQLIQNSSFVKKNPAKTCKKAIYSSIKIIYKNGFTEFDY